MEVNEGWYFIIIKNGVFICDICDGCFNIGEKTFQCGVSKNQNAFRFIEFIREMGIVYRRNILGEYLVILNKTKDPQEAQKEFERKITSP